MHTHSEGWQLMLPALVPFGRYRSITPEPTSVSPSYQTANWPGVTPRWGSSKSRYPVSYTHLDVYKRQINYFPVSAAWAAARRAIGTRNGEQLT